MKNLFIVFLSFLILASCKDKEKPAIPITKITLEPNPASVAVGAKLKLTPVLTPAEASNKTLTWESSAPTIATVDNQGEVTGVAAGTATITATATDGSKVTATTALTVKNNISAITLGAEKFNLTIPADGSTTITLNNAPHTLSSIIKEVPVNITVADGATIRVGTEDFTQGQKVDFSNSQTFTVSVQNGATTKFIIAITAYHATTNPYGVYTVAHLNDVRNDKAGSYKLMNDLTLPALNDAGAAATTGIEDYAKEGWLPIAHDAGIEFTELGIRVDGGFMGTFDGGNFSVNNLYTKRSLDYVGLFGVTYWATLKDLGITGTTSPITTTSKYTGTLAGLISRSTVTNCHAVNFSISFVSKSDQSSAGGLVGYSSQSKISNCYATGNVAILSDHISYAGGLVGHGGASISNCYATGSVSINFNTTSRSAPLLAIAIVGGLVGLNEGNISNCYATGSVSASSSDATAGGLVGRIGSYRTTISNSYATGSVSADATDTYIYAAAIAGGLAGDSGFDQIISNCYATGSVSAKARSPQPRSSGGGLVGRSQSTISNCYATGSVSSSSIIIGYSSSSSDAVAGGLVGLNEGAISNCYATGNVSVDSDVAVAGGLVGKKVEGGTYSNCYRNSDAEIKKRNKVVANPDDASFTGIAAKSKKDMQIDAFTTSLNKDVSVWGRSSGKNDDLPYIKGVGVGKN